jgi:hypothetical protein
VISNDRPVPRSRPRPAPDDALDPIHSAPPRSPRRGPEATVQLNVRVAGDISDLLDREHRATDRTKRELIEHAIRTTYS